MTAWKEKNAQGNGHQMQEHHGGVRRSAVFSVTIVMTLFGIIRTDLICAFAILIWIRMKAADMKENVIRSKRKVKVINKLRTK